MIGIGVHPDPSVVKLRFHDLPRLPFDFAQGLEPVETAAEPLRRDTSGHVITGLTAGAEACGYLRHFAPIATSFVRVRKNIMPSKSPASKGMFRPTDEGSGPISFTEPTKE